ncbi:MAG: hypothetical protein NZ899_10700 [Thermoguttaceae bacterium]|nr:hypothetical protein [Thermoguttaceae bacterium]MDW8078937.1 hypothetical protein [Thermoguttaceae bacterium]
MNRWISLIVSILSVAAGIVLALAISQKGPELTFLRHSTGPKAAGQCTTSADRVNIFAEGKRGRRPQGALQENAPSPNIINRSHDSSTAESALTLHHPENSSLSSRPPGSSIHDLKAEIADDPQTDAPAAPPPAAEIRQGESAGGPPADRSPTGKTVALAETRAHTDPPVSSTTNPVAHPNLGESQTPQEEFANQPTTGAEPPNAPTNVLLVPTEPQDQACASPRSIAEAEMPTLSNRLQAPSQGNPTPAPESTPPSPPSPQDGAESASPQLLAPSSRVKVRPVAQERAPSPEGTAPPASPPALGSPLLIEIDNEEIRTVLTILARQAGVNILVSKSVQGTITATLRDLDWQAALQAILRTTGYVARQYEGYIFVGTAEECEQMDQIHGGLGLRVYRPKFVSAKELQALLQPLITTGVGIVSVSSPAESGIASDATRAGGDSYAGGDVVIVRDYESVLARLDQLVAEVDKKPPQVAIEAMILAVRLNDEDALGINFELFRNRPRFRLGWEDPPASLADIRFDAGLKVAFLDGSISSFVSALQQIRDTNVIAAPRLLVLNKHRAEIQIGKEQGYVSTTITETAASQSVEFLDTGTLLRIRPFVLGDKMVRLEVHPELSDGDVRELAGFTVPQKDITQVTTNVLVPDGATVVIGGLIRHELSSGGSQIPVLGNIPWVGALFRSRSSQQLREEIIVLITPHIIGDAEAWQQALEAKARFDQQFAVAAELSTPLGRRNVARRFFRLAESAWKAGDCQRARRLAELALHFDPHLEEAIALREAVAGPLGPIGPAVSTLGTESPLPPPQAEQAPVFLLPQEPPPAAPRDPKTETLRSAERRSSQPK